ncbi:TetR/AcrR family transcriptional regulator [Novosphingobium lentum]|uniref:TetR/AcrR family transcriptional regulator n=1 Tax=Novosphingobium lentum TaxID=145287 RepID=UPI00082E1E9C|nr:TetR/AcrR family transcriptional regulator [Novosphingobium lentum]
MAASDPAPTKTPASAPAPNSRRRGRPPADAASAVPEERVLHLAFESFAEFGYEGTTVRELAKRLGVSHNLLNVRFGSKADLWRRAVDWRVARFGAPVFSVFDRTDLDPESRLRLLVHRFCGWAAENPSFISISHAEGRRSTWRLDYLVALYIQPFKHSLDALFGEVLAIRPMRGISSSAFMAMLVQGVGFYFASTPMLEALGVGEEADPEAIPQRVGQFADTLLAGLLGPASSMAVPDRQADAIPVT